MGTFGAYRLLEKLSSSAVSEVHLAQRTGADELCVLKILAASADEVAKKRFVREAQLAAILEHENIVRVFDAGLEGRAYLVTEHVSGRDLAAFLGRLFRQGKVLPVELGVLLMFDILAGLHYAHELCDSAGKPLELVHRDVAPRNVLVTYDGRAKLIDFGVAHARLGDFRTAPGMVVGTLRYMSPEQAAAKTIDRRSDIYSAAVMFFELLSGRPGVAERTPRDILAAIAVDSLPRLSSVVPGAPPFLDGVLERALAKDPASRFPTAEAFAQAIRGAVPEPSVRSRAELGALVASLFAEEKAARDRLIREVEARGDSVMPTVTAHVPRPRTPPSPQSPRSVQSPRSRKHRVQKRPVPIAWAISAVAMFMLAAALIGFFLREAPVAEPPPPSLEQPEPVPPPAPEITARPRESEPTPQPPPPPPDDVVVVEPTRERERRKEIPAKITKEKKIDRAIVRLKNRLEALESGKAAPADVLDLSARIVAEAERIDDTAARTAIRSRAHTSGMVGDLEGLAQALKELERALGN